MEFIRKNLLSLAIVVLLVIVVLQKCAQPNPSEEPTIVRDTAWVVKDSLIYSKPQLVKTIEVESHDTIINQYIPDTNYAKLVLQYQEIVNQLLAKNIMEDSIRIDSNGYVKITDTVQKNLIVGRGTQVNIKYPIITETITIPPKKVTQLYVGGVLQGTPVINQIGASALLKTRKDFIIGASLSVNTYGDLQYGTGVYWKIKLKKK
jgi:hypothetical protein